MPFRYAPPGLRPSHDASTHHPCGRSWGNYGGYAFHYIAELAGHRGNHTRDLFAQHAAAGQLPAISWLYGDGRPDRSEHPTQNVTDGMAWTLRQTQAVIDGGCGTKR